jgi:hypothetical protein
MAWTHMMNQPMLLTVLARMEKVRTNISSSPFGIKLNRMMFTEKQANKQNTNQKFIENQCSVNYGYIFKSKNGAKTSSIVHNLLKSKFMYTLLPK